MIDAAGAIYVIGGTGDSTGYKDVWVSTDGGARAGPGRGVVRGVYLSPALGRVYVLRRVHATPSGRCCLTTG